MKPKTLLLFGAIGFMIVLVLNLFSLVVLKQSAATPFADAWWPTWFTHYAVWIVIYLIGVYRYAIK